MEFITKKVESEVLPPIVKSINIISKVFEISLVKDEIDTTVLIKLSIFISNNFNMHIDIIFTTETLSIRTLIIGFPLK